MIVERILFVIILKNKTLNREEEKDKMANKRDSVYKTSTQKERIIKSIKLELVPHEATARALVEHGTREKDDSLIKISEDLKPLLTEATKNHIEAALSELNIDFSDFFEKYSSVKRKDNLYSFNDYRKAEENLVKKITKHMEIYKYNEISAKDIGSATYFKKFLPNMLETASMSSEEREHYVNCLNRGEGLTTLMKSYITSRKTAVTTWSVNRVIENAEIYANNIAAIREFLDSSYADAFIADFPELISMASYEYYEIGCITPVGIEGYNKIISGEFDENGNCKIKGFNAIINEINMKNRTDAEYQGIFYKKIKPLYNQVLFSPKPLFTIEQIEDNDSMRDFLQETFREVSKEKLFNLVEFIKTADASDISIHGNNIGSFSHITTGNYAKLYDSIIAFEEQKCALQYETLNSEIKEEKDNDKLAKLKVERKNLKKNINNISKYVASKDYSVEELESISGKDSILDSYFANISTAYKNISAAMSAIYDTDIFEDGEIRRYHKNKMAVKGYIDAITNFNNIVKLISQRIDRDAANPLFYNRLDEMTEFLEYSKKAVKMIQNYMRRKTGDIAKEYNVCLGSASKYSIKWWNEDIENNLKVPFETNIGTIINIEGKYYFCVKGYNQKSFELEYAAPGDEYYEVFNQKTAQDATKILPKKLFKEKVIPYFAANPIEKEVDIVIGDGKVTVTRDMLRIYNEKLFTVEAKKSGLISENQFKSNLATLIDLYKSYIELNPHFKRFHFNFKETWQYNDIGEFMQEANTFMLDATWIKIKKIQIDELISGGKLYAFLIKNRNMYEDRVKTSYAEVFLALMSHENCESGNMRLNACPQITFRPACIPYSVTHPTGSILLSKKDRNGRYIRNDYYKQIYAYLNNQRSRDELSVGAVKLIDDELITYCTASHEHIRDLRYKVDKYFISLSYVKNAKVSERAYNDISSRVQQNMEDNIDGNNILVVSRGTEDLIYYRLYDKNKQLIEEASLNKIGDVDYSKKLKALSVERKQKTRDEWDYSVIVKNYKAWYLNVAISKILQVAEKYQALIIIESISDGFKDRMSCIDNQVYKSFETKLENRLMDYHRKHDLSNKPGSLINPLQLISSYNSNNNGVLIKVNAAYLDSMDRNGFINLFDTSRITTQQHKLDFIRKMDSIRYDRESGLLEVKFNYKNFRSKRLIDHAWTIYVGKPQSVYDRQTDSYVYIEKPLEHLLEKIKDSVDLDDNLATSVTDKAIGEKIYDTIMLAVKKYTYHTNDNDYITTLTEKEFVKTTIAQNKCDNMASKYWFLRENKDEKDYLDSWIKSRIVLK